MPFGKWKFKGFEYAIEGKPDCKEIGVEWERYYGTIHNPKGLMAGAYWYGRWETKVQLIKDGRVVGFL